MHDNEAQPSPKGFVFGGQPRPSYYESPELPAEVAVERAVAPPALLRRRWESRLYLVAQVLEELGDADQHGDSLAAQGLHDRARLKLLREYRRPSE